MSRVSLLSRIDLVFTPAAYPVGPRPDADRIAVKPPPPHQTPNPADPAATIHTALDPMVTSELAATAARATSVAFDPASGGGAAPTQPPADDEEGDGET